MSMIRLALYDPFHSDYEGLVDLITKDTLSPNSTEQSGCQRAFCVLAIETLAHI